MLNLETSDALNTSLRNARSAPTQYKMWLCRVASLSNKGADSERRAFCRSSHPFTVFQQCTGVPDEIMAHDATCGLQVMLSHRDSDRRALPLPKQHTADA